MGRWLVVHALGALALCGCGRLSFDELAPDASGAPLGPFGTPQVIPELSTTSAEDDPALPGDELEIYFDSDRPGGMGAEDIWRASRPDVLSPWGPAQAVTELNTASADLSPGISLDGLTLIFSRNVGGGTGLDFYLSTRPDRTSGWGPPVRIDELSDIGEDTNAQVSADGLTIWFNSKRNSTVVRQMWTSTRPSLAAPWTPPVAVNALNVASDVYTGDASPTADDRLLFFVTDRLDGATKNIWIADRPTPSTLANPRPVAELGSANQQTDPWISIDQHRLYYADHVGGSADIVLVTR